MVYQRPQKGKLPVPRDPFPANRPGKGTAEYVEAIAKPQLPSNIIPAQDLTEAGTHKRKMAELRKAHLREGVTGLYERKQMETAAVEARSALKKAQRDALLQQAVREDERLMNASVTSGLTQGTVSELGKQISIAQGQRSKKLRKQALRENDSRTVKMDALHTLYMNAKNFITSEDQLREKIKAQFDKADPNSSGVRKHADFQTDVREGLSLWNFGPPDGIKQMLASESPGSKSSETTSMLNKISNMSRSPTARVMQDMEKAAAETRRDQARMKRIAEKLSGGKI